MDRRKFVKGSLVAGAGMALAGKGWPQTSASKPNLIIVLCDDLGYGDIGCMGNNLIRTPAIDSLAAHGCRLTDFYSSASVCSPSRAGLLTGRYPPRTGIIQVLFPSVGVESIVNARLAMGGAAIALPRDELTIADLLKPAGYATCMIGKWHLGDLPGAKPNDRGFDHYLGVLYSNDMVPLTLYRNKSVAEKAPADQDYLTRKYAEEAVWFIKENKNRPFFIHFCSTFPHVPLHASPEFRGKSQAGLYGDCVEEIDWAVGKILEALDGYGIAENTLIIFTSDNGPWWTGNPGYHRGRKNDTFDGGMCVPFAASWPAQIPAGQVLSQPCMNIDLFSTCLAAAGVNPPADRVIDGRNLLPLLAGREKKSPHEFIYFYKAGSLEAVRSGDWKYQLRHYIHYAPMGKAQGPWLFNLKDDPNESYNLYDERPEITAEFEKEIAQWRKNFGRGLGHSPGS